MKAKINTPAAKKSTRNKPAAKRRPGAMGKAETVPLAIAAREAFDYQVNLGLIEPGDKFDDWRRAQVFSLTERKGLTDCDHVHFRPLLAHFQTLAGKDAEAFASLMKSGAVRDNGPADDTHEARATLARVIMDALADHIRLADTPWPQLLQEWTAESKAAWATEPDNEQPWPGLDGTKLARASISKAAIEDNGGPIREGYLVAIARMKTRRPDLNLGSDLAKGLADRCSVKQLTQLRDTLVNRIAATEGRGTTQGRNKKQRDHKVKAAKTASAESRRW